MPFLLQAVMIVACILLLAYVVHLIKHERLQLRYSLLWLALAVLVLLCSVIPGPLLSISRMFGFEAASNFIFVAAFLIVLLIALSLSSIVSKQAIAIKNLAQRIAIVEKDLEEKAGGDDESNPVSR